jgi:hypothetical protein
VGALLGLGAEAFAGPAVRVTGGFPLAARDRWSFVRFDANHDGSGEKTARLSMTRESGAQEVWEVTVTGLAPVSQVRYDYVGAPDPVASAEIEMDGARATWERPARIPSSRLAVILTADDGRALPVSTLLGGRKGLGLVRARPDGLPDRWAAWRRVTAVVAWEDELPGPGAAEGRALRDYVRAGGTVLLYPGDGVGGLFGDLPAGDADLGRGKVLRLGRGGHPRPPALNPPPPPPTEAPLLVAAPSKAPVGWLNGRLAWVAPLLLLSLVAVRRRPGSGLLAFALVLGGAIVATPAPPATPAAIREARWEDGAGYVRRELALTPGRTGSLELPGGPEASVVALDPAAGLRLSMAASGIVSMPGRWGESVDILVETVARAD